MIVKGGRNVFLGRCLLRGPSREKTCGSLSQAQYHRFRHVLPALYVPCLCHRKTYPSRDPDSWADLDHPPFSASSIEPVSIPIERRVKTFERLLSAPISLYSLVSGESQSGFLYSLGIASSHLLSVSSFSVRPLCPHRSL